MTWRPGLLTRLVVATVAAGVLAAVIGVFVLDRAARDTLRSEILDRNAALAVELASRLDERIETEVSHLVSIATREALSGTPAAATTELEVVLAYQEVVDELVLYDLAGRPVAVTANSYLADPARAAARRDLVDAHEGPLVTLVLDGSVPAVDIVVPVENPPGNPVALLGARIMLEPVARPALRRDLAFGTTRSLLTQDGRIVVHPERDKVIRGERFPLEAVATAQTSTARLDLDGRAHLAAVAEMSTLDVVVVVDQAESAALDPAASRLRELSLILAAVITSMVLAVSLAGAWLLSPLAPLVSAVERLGQRERGVRVDERRPAEVGALAAEFNRLAGSLDERRDELAELQRLSLLVNTLTTRDDVAAEVVRGAARLAQAQVAAFYVLDDGLPTIVASHGPLEETEAREVAATALRVGGTRSWGGTPAHAAVGVSTIDGRPLGAIVISSNSSAAELPDLGIIEAYAAFAAVALDNAERIAMRSRLTDELAEAIDQRRHLLATVSHEFDTPLTCIDGFSTLLEEHWEQFTDAERTDLVGKIRLHTDELKSLVDRLLDFAVTERGTLEAAPQQVAVADVVASLVDSMSGQLDGRPVTIDVPDVTVHADPVLIRRALSNLVSNAVKYSNPGTPVTLRAIDEGRRVRLEVTDEGIGIDAEEASRAFEPFWRSANPRVRSARGAGLGLSLVAEYARSMGGAVGVVSEPGRGSTFFVTVPRAHPDQRDRRPDAAPGTVGSPGSR